MPRKYYTKNKKYKKWNKPIYPGETNNIHFFKRYSVAVTPFVIQTTDVGAAVINKNLVFTLDDVSGNTELKALYDVYRIKYVKVVMTPRTQVVTQSISTTGSGFVSTVKLLHAIDYDSSSPGQTPAALREYQSCKIIEYGDTKNKNLTVFFTPRINILVEQSDAGNGSLNSQGWQWIDTQSAAVRHYGLKMILQNSGATWGSVNVGQGYDINVQYYLEFKNSR